MLKHQASGTMFCVTCLRDWEPVASLLWTLQEERSCLCLNLKCLPKGPLHDGIDLQTWSSERRQSLYKLELHGNPLGHQEQGTRGHQFLPPLLTLPSWPREGQLCSAILSSQSKEANGSWIEVLTPPHTAPLSVWSLYQTFAIMLESS